MTVATRNESNTQLLDQVQKMMDVLWERDSRNYRLAVLSAMLRHLQGRYEEEIKFYRQALALRPGDPSATNNLAWVLSEGMNRTNEALALIDDLIARNGRKPDAIDTRGVILTRAARYDDAIKDLEESLAAAPSAVGYFHLATAYRKAGRVEDFRKCRELALKAGLTPGQADPVERNDVASMLRP